MTYIIPVGSLKGKPITTMDDTFLREAVSRGIQPPELFNACVAELNRRDLPVPARREVIREGAFDIPPPRHVAHIPDSVAEVAAGARAVSPVPAVANPPLASHGNGSPRASATESLPMPCGHPTSDLAWDDDSKARSVCIACMREQFMIKDLKRAFSAGQPDAIEPLVHGFALDVRNPEWPHG